MRNVKFNISKLAKRIGDNLLIHKNNGAGTTNKGNLDHYDHLHMFYK